MKNQLFSIITLALLTIVACKQPAVVEEVESPDYAAFDKNVDVLRAFIKAHSDEDLNAQLDLLSDTLKWSPASYNGNKMLGKTDYAAVLKNIHDDYESIKYTEGIMLGDSLVNGMWSGSVFPKQTATQVPNTIRMYGTWTATHTASGKDVGVKWFALGFLNDDSKIVQISEYYDAHGLAAQIAAQTEEEGEE